MNTKYFIIDFDSTIVQAEGLEVLADIVLKNHKEKDQLLQQIADITRQGMEGTLAFDESLKKRLALLPITKKDVTEAVSVLKKKVSPSIKRNKQFFKTYKDSIFIVSGGFKEFIIPITAELGIPATHIFANTFMFDKKGKVSGIDESNELSQKGGKATVVQKLQLAGEIFVIGDGSTDLEIAKSQELRAKSQVTFIAYTETVFREKVAKEADYVVPNFDEFLYIYNLPRAVSYPKNRISVLLLENINQRAISAFEKEGYAVEYFGKSLPKDELLKKIDTVSILGIRSKTQIDTEILKKARHLQAIGAFCIGTDQIDLLESTKRGIAVFNAPYSNTRSVVELVIGEIIILARGIFPKSSKLHQGIWDKSAKGSFEVRGKTLGIIGYGNIGSQVSILAEALGMNVLYFDTVEKLALGTAKQCSSIKEVLRKSDVITVHVDGNKKNKHLIGEKEFAQMKDGVLFLNLSRGFVVEMASLVKYLKMGKIGGAAIDVFPKEPEGKGDNFVSELQGMENVILTPHIGGSTKEAQENIGQFVSSKLIEYMNTGSTYLSVSLPQVQLPTQGEAHRLLHIHHNVPGILATINKILAANTMNIVGQYLKTNEEIGYVITDVDKKYDARVLQQLQEIENTIKFRVLY